MKIVQHLKQHWFWYLANAAALFPLAWLVWDFWFDNLSPNPIQDLTFRTGKPAIILLLISLACTPVNTLTGWRDLITLRKSMGLQAFYYATIHFLIFLGLDYGFNLNFILQDGIVKKPYILLGLAAFLILVPLAITSTKGWQKSLGKRWKKLHRYVYAAGVLAVLHFFWLAKAANRWEPLLYGGILALLLIMRIPAVRTWMISQRQRWEGKPEPKRPVKMPAKTAVQS